MDTIKKSLPLSVIVEFARVLDAATAKYKLACEIASELKKQYPGKAREIDAAIAACASPIVSNCPTVRAGGALAKAIFAVHCRQFLSNIGNGIDADRPTLVELLIIVTTLHADHNDLPIEISLLVLTDKVTMETFGHDPIPVPEVDFDRDRCWEALASAHRAMYTNCYGYTRSQFYKRALMGESLFQDKGPLPERHGESSMSTELFKQLACKLKLDTRPGKDD